MRFSLLVSAAALALAACDNQESTLDNAAAQGAASAILTQTSAEKIVSDAEAAWSSERVESVMANYANGAVVFDTTTLPPTTDRNVQTRGNAAFLTMKPADFRVEQRNIQLLGNDAIVASGVLSFTANVGAARPVLRTRYTQVYHRQPDGGFKIVHEHMSSPPPGTGTP